MQSGQEVRFDPEQALAREWLLTNGLGGYAAGTAAGAPAKRTHGLLVSADLHGRQHLLLLQLLERATCDGVVTTLGHTLAAAGAPSSGTRATLEAFRLDPWPTWRYRAGAAIVERTVFTLHRHHAIVVAYRHLEGPEARLGVSPLVVARAPGELQRERADVRGVAQGVPGRVRIETFEGAGTLTLWHNGAFMPARLWQRGIVFPHDEDGSTEDAFVPGHVEGTLAPGRALFVVASAEDDLFRVLATEERLGVPPPKTLADCVTALDAGERDRLVRWRRGTIQGADFTARQAAAAHGGPHESIARRREPLVDESHPGVGPLSLALRAGLARRGMRTTLLAALPESRESGSETLRALPALVALRAFDAARDVLRGHVEYLDEGLAPERFDLDDGTPVYGDPAPSLWLVHAADLYARRSADGTLLNEVLFPALEGVMQFFRSGTRGVGVDVDGLLSSGEGKAAMKRADLNALWYHALVAMAQLARLIGRKEGGAFYLAWAHEHQKRFNEAFWDEERGCLYESLGVADPVRGVSPGQLLAVSLPPSLLNPERAARLVHTVEGALFTPYGLRGHPTDTRVSTAWLGPFISAYLRVHDRDAAAQARVREWLALVGQAAATGIAGHVPEWFELEPGAGSPAQRRVAAGPNVSMVASAELLRVWVEEVDHGMSPASDPATVAGKR